MTVQTPSKQPSVGSSATAPASKQFCRHLHFVVFLLSFCRNNERVDALRPAFVSHNDRIQQSRLSSCYKRPTSTTTIHKTLYRQHATRTTTTLFSTPPGDDDLFIDVDPDDDESDDELNDNGITDAFDEIIFVVDPTATESELDEDEDEEDDDDDEEEDPYTKVAASEFQDDKPDNRRKDDVGALTLLGEDKLENTMMDWGGALSTLRERVEDVESGKAQDPSHVLFRMMSNQTPNQIIGQFVSNADPMVVQAMSGAVASLLGGLSNPNMGVETLVKASGEKIGSLCFQLQMTGA